MPFPKDVYGRVSLIGGGLGALDAIDGADLEDLDIAIVTTLIAVYIYSLDEDSAAAESSPDVITPDANAGDKRWILVSVDSKVTARRLENLCRNAAFGSRSKGDAAEADEWELEGTPTVGYASVDLGYGDFSVILTATGAGNEGWKQTLTHLKPNSKYQIFVRVKATAGDTARLLTTGATTNIDEETTSTGYVSLTGKFVTDASGTDVVIKLLAKAAGDIVFFCGITCVEGDIPPGNFIRRVHEVIHLTTALTDASFDGDAFSDTETDIDLSAFGNGCPVGIKAVLASFQMRDSGSAATYVELAVGLGGVALDARMKKCLFFPFKGIVDDFDRGISGWFPCDANGDVRIKIDASGASTFDLWIYIWGYVLGE